MQVYKNLTEDGHVVFLPAFNCDPLLHRKKIDMSDLIFVVNVGGYIGKTTAEEIADADKKGKGVLYFEGMVLDPRILAYREEKRND